ncbi:MAG TPA: ROK family protein, partial [Verrucomicrobiales bacterium]|nr:ROK family protein [Verrucomicrobiales bacterium]
MKESAHDHWLGFDLGGTKMFAVVFDGSMQVVGRFRQKTHGQRGKDEGVPRVLWCIEQSLATAGLEAGRLAGIGIGCPGVVDWRDGILVDAPNLGWSNVRLAAAVEEHFGVPARLVNDVDAGTYGEFRQGAGRGAGTLLGVFPGTGLGAGCIVDGRLLRHRRYSCMELGRMRIPSTSLVGNDCGLIPVETACSRLAIASACAMEAYRGRAPTVFELAGTD